MLFKFLISFINVFLKLLKFDCIITYPLRSDIYLIFDSSFIALNETNYSLINFSIYNNFQ
jgi:hypothetical protein